MKNKQISPQIAKTPDSILKPTTPQQTVNIKTPSTKKKAKILKLKSTSTFIEAPPLEPQPYNKSPPVPALWKKMTMLPEISRLDESSPIVSPIPA